MDYAQGYRDGYSAGYAAGRADMDMMGHNAPLASQVTPPKPKRKVSAYSRAYGRAYRSLRKKHTLKNGKLRKGYTHKRLVKLAHAEAKRRRKK